MAVSRGSGTEIIRTIHLTDLDNTSTQLIYGVRHHIYTVLSVICYAGALQASGNWIRMFITGYDSKAGTAQQPIYIFRQDIVAGDSTFVWNDKFSFNGHEPVDFTGPVDSEAKQDAIADQLVSGDSNRQVLSIQSENASDDFDITCTFIDQNNA